MKGQRIKKIKGVDMGSLHIGEPAILYLPNGKVIKTSPVKSWYINALAHICRIETTNSIYIA